MEEINFIKNRSKEFGELLEKLEKNAPDHVQFMADRERLEYLKSLKDKSDFLPEMWRLEDEIKKNSIFVYTLNELKILLEKTKMSKEEQVEVLAHENAHANKADSLDFKHKGYALHVWKYGDKFGYSVGAIIQPSENLGIEKNTDIWAQILKAPEEYGNNMSDKDKIDLEKLKNKDKK